MTKVDYLVLFWLLVRRNAKASFAPLLEALEPFDIVAAQVERSLADLSRLGLMTNSRGALSLTRDGRQRAEEKLRRRIPVAMTGWDDFKKKVLTPLAVDAWLGAAHGDPSDATAKDGPLAPRSSATRPPAAGRGATQSPSGARVDSDQDDARVMDALRAVEKRNPPGKLLAPREVRAEAGLDKPRFDAAVLRLGKADKVSIHDHDFPSSLKPAEREQLVYDARQNRYFVGIRSRGAGRLDDGSTPEPAEDLATFAQRVLATARASKTGRFGDNKVFISHVFRQLRPAGLDEDAFKARLVEAHRAGLLGLSRADLVEAMDARDVDESETRYLSATFHLVRLPEQPPSTSHAAAEPTGDLAAFARRVLAAARASKTGRFGDDKVFISHVFRQLRPAGLDEDAFKARLVQAHRARLLSLNRADLVEAMDPKDVEESETRYLSATFHFVRLPHGGPR